MQATIAKLEGGQSTSKTSGKFLSCLPRYFGRTWGPICDAPSLYIDLDVQDTYYVHSPYVYIA